MTKPKILLSFDIEEFDLPLEYGQKIDESTQFDISWQGLNEMIKILEHLDITATFFVTANFAQQYPSAIRALSDRHEIASHGLYHSHCHPHHLRDSRLILENLTGKPIQGFRMPRLQPVNASALQAAGYHYNSSLNPTYIPGRYNHFFQPRTYHYQQHLLHIPTSVTPLIRFPLFWLSFELFPLPVLQLASAITLKWDHYLCLYFHPWEFTNLQSFCLPNFIKNNCGETMKHKLTAYLHWLNSFSDFITYAQFARYVGD